MIPVFKLLLGGVARGLGFCLLGLLGACLLGDI
jgi:hypothetical protein